MPSNIESVSVAITELARENDLNLTLILQDDDGRNAIISDVNCETTSTFSIFRRIIRDTCENLNHEQGKSELQTIIEALANTMSEDIGFALCYLKALSENGGIDGRVSIFERNDDDDHNQDQNESAREDASVH